MKPLAKIKKSEIPNGKARSYQIGENKIVVCNINDEFYAVEDICSHDAGELVSGEIDLIETCQLQCPRHGARFDVKTGKATKMPAVASIRTYKIIVNKDELEIESEVNESEVN